MPDHPTPSEGEKLVRAFLREGEDVRLSDWSISEPTYCAEAGFPEIGQSFNAFADGWGATPAAAWDALGWKLTERSTSGRIGHPFGLDRWPILPDAEERRETHERARRSMSRSGYEHATAMYYPEPPDA